MARPTNTKHRARTSEQGIDFINFSLSLSHVMALVLPSSLLDSGAQCTKGVPDLPDLQLALFGTVLLCCFSQTQTLSRVSLSLSLSPLLTDSLFPFVL